MNATIRRALTGAALGTAALTALALPATANAATPTAATAHAVAASRAVANSCNAYWVTASALRVHTGPGTGYTAIGQLYRWDDVAVTSTRGGWSYITVLDSNSLRPGTHGWVSSAYLTEEACSTLD